MSKIKKGKALGFAMVGLAAVAVTSIGFSTWIVQSLTPTEEQSVSLAVADTVDMSISLAVTGTPDLSVTFDAATGDTAGDITASSTQVDMTFGFTFTITVNSGTVPSIVGSIVPTFTALSGLTSSISSNYVVAPLTSGTALNLTLAAGTYYDGSTTSKTNYKEKYVVTATSTTVYTVDATFQFLWGTFFGGVNPSLCDSAFSPAYNNHALSDILTALGNLKTNLNDKTIAALVLTPVAA